MTKHIPNEETKKALEESRNGVGVISHGSEDQLFKDLGLDSTENNILDSLDVMEKDDNNVAKD